MNRRIRFPAPLLVAIGLTIPSAAVVGTPDTAAGQESGSSSVTLERYRHGWDVLDRAAEVLGGWDALGSLDGLTVWMHGTESDRFQSPSPEPPFRRLGMEMTLVLDFENARIGSDLRVHWPDFVQHIRRLGGPEWGLVEFPGRGAAELDSTLRNADLDFIARRVPHHLLRSARARPAAVRYLGRRVRDGRVQEVVTMTGAEDDLLSVYVDSVSGRIAGYERLVQDWRAGDTSYELRYGDWTSGAEHSHPRTIRVFRAGVPVAEATVDSIRPGIAGMRAMVARYDSLASSSAMAAGGRNLPPVRTLATGVHLAEQLDGRDYNMLFVEVGDGLLAADAPLGEDATARALEAVRTVAGDLPVRYVVPTHHHRDHAGGVRALVAEGATVVTTGGNVALFRDVATAVRSLDADPTPPPDTVRFEEVEGRKHVVEAAGRSIHLYDVGPNPHATEHLVIHLPEERLLFQGDLIRFPRDGGVEPARPHATALLRLIEDEQLEVERILGTHGRPGTMDDLRAAFEAASGRES